MVLAILVALIVTLSVKAGMFVTEVAYAAAYGFIAAALVTLCIFAVELSRAVRREDAAMDKWRSDADAAPKQDGHA